MRAVVRFLGTGFLVLSAFVALGAHGIYTGSLWYWAAAGWLGVWYIVHDGRLFVEQRGD